MTERYHNVALDLHMFKVILVIRKLSEESLPRVYAILSSRYPAAGAVNERVVLAHQRFHPARVTGSDGVIEVIDDIEWISAAHGVKLRYCIHMR